MARVLRLVVCVGVFVSAAASAPPAWAAFPGSNGRIFFDSNRLGLPATQLYSVLPGGNGLQQLTDFGPRRSASQANLSADGHEVVLVVSRARGNDQLWLMGSDGTNLRQVTREPHWTHDTPAFTPKGEIVYSRCGPYVAPYFTCKIVSIDADGMGQKVIVGGTWHPNDVAVSPDGETIAYVSDRGGYDARLWLVDTNGDHPRPIVPGFKVLERPSWAPDGSQIAFGGLKNQIKVYVVDSDGSDPHVVATRATFPSWSPDGRWIAFFSEGDSALERAHPNGDGVTAVMDPSVDPGAGDTDWGVAP
jgi:Tol biopolymer transport system component